MRFAALFFLIFICLPAQAQDVFETPAEHAVIMDFDTGLVLFEKDAREPTAPASMTKIMTAHIVFEHLRSGSLTMDTEFTVSDKAWRRKGSTMFLEPGESVRVEDLLKGVIIQSGNDACITLAEGISGSEDAFAELMTRRGQELGMENAEFRNSTGWPHPEHNISTRDLALLARETISEFPEYYAFYNMRNFTWKGIPQDNRNPLLGRFEGADGLKTGHTEASGYGFVASAERDGTRRIVVVNGLNSQAQRRSESERLMRAAFDSFDVYPLYGAEDIVTEATVFMGREDKVALMANGPVNIGMAKIARSDLTIQVEMPKETPAPIVKGQVIGKLVVTAPGMDKQIFELQAAEDVAQKSAFGRAGSALVRLLGG